MTAATGSRTIATRAAEARPRRGRAARRVPLLFALFTFAVALLGAAPADARAAVQPLSIVREQELRFGRLVVVGASGAVVMPARGLPDFRGAISVGGSTGPALLSLRGKPGRLVEVLLLDPPPVRWGASGTSRVDALAVEADFRTGFERTHGVVRLRLDPGGSNRLTIGGRLTVTPGGGRGPVLVPIPVSARYVEGGNDDSDDDKDDDDDRSGRPPRKGSAS